MIRDDMTDGRLTFIIDSDDKVLYITSVYVPDAHRGRGGALALLAQCAQLARRHNIPTLKLDDMSARYRRADNIYIHCGFMYDDKHWGPEMTAKTSVVERSCRVRRRLSR